MVKFYDTCRAKENIKVQSDLYHSLVFNLSTGRKWNFCSRCAKRRFHFVARESNKIIYPPLSVVKNAINHRNNVLGFASGINSPVILIILYFTSRDGQYTILLHGEKMSIFYRCVKRRCCFKSQVCTSLGFVSKINSKLISPTKSIERNTLFSQNSNKFQYNSDFLFLIFFVNSNSCK